MLKKTSIALFITAASSVAMAGSMGPVCAPGAVTVPCASKQWDFGVQALYLKPTFNQDRAYGFAPAGIYTHTDADWDYGYRLEGAYHFSTGADISLDWSHFDANNNTIGNFASGAVTRFGRLSFPSTSLNVDNRFDQANLVMGQHVDFGLLKDARFFGGMQYANIANNASLAIANVALSSTTFITSYYNNSQFEGFGPVLGIDYAYSLVDGLSLTATTSASMVYGSSRSSTGLQALSSGSPVMLSTAYASRKMLVTGLEGKLGANYAHAMADGTLNLEGGYQVVDYINALASVNLAYGVGQSDFALSGPYLGLKWIANA